MEAIKETVADRILGAGRSDVLFGVTLPPKNHASEREARQAIVDDHVATVARGCTMANVGAYAFSSAVSKAAMDAGLYLLSMLAGNRHAKILTLWAATRSALTNPSAKDAMTPASAALLAEGVAESKLDDFVRWWWRLGEYAIPNSAAGAESQSAGQPSSAQS